MDDDSKALNASGALEGKVIPVGSAAFFGNFRSNPVKTCAEVMMGGLQTAKENPFELAKGVARVVEAGFSGRLLERLGKEWDKLREIGRIDDDESLAKRKYVINSFIDLLKIIDSNPEEDKLEAVKSLFFLLASVGSDEKADALRYEMFQIVCRMNASQLIVFKAIYDVRDNGDLNRYVNNVKNGGGFMLSVRDWYLVIAKKTGYQVIELVERDIRSLVELDLVDPILVGGRGKTMHCNNFKLNGLGVLLYESLSAVEKWSD